MKLLTATADDADDCSGVAGLSSWYSDSRKQPLKGRSLTSLFNHSNALATNQLNNEVTAMLTKTKSGSHISKLRVSSKGGWDALQGPGVLQEDLAAIRICCRWVACMHGSCKTLAETWEQEGLSQKQQ